MEGDGIPVSVVIGCLTAIVGCLAVTGFVHRARSTGNLVNLVCALGAVLVVAGVVGQRTFPNQDRITAVGADVAAQEHPGPWDAGVGIPVPTLGSSESGLITTNRLRATPVTLAGILVVLLGVSALLFFEPRAAARRRPAAIRPRLEEDDAV